MVLSICYVPEGPSAWPLWGERNRESGGGRPRIAKLMRPCANLVNRGSACTQNKRLNAVLTLYPRIAACRNTAKLSEKTGCWSVYDNNGNWCTWKPSNTYCSTPFYVLIEVTVEVVRERWGWLLKFNIIPIIVTRVIRHTEKRRWASNNCIFPSKYNFCEVETSFFVWWLRSEILARDYNAYYVTF